MEFSVYLAYAALFLIVSAFGASIGSFLNVLIYRVPRGISFVKGRSYCPDCGTRIAARDLVPVVSYLILKGRCRNCGGRISGRYPFIESICGLLAVMTAVRYDFAYAWAPVFLLGALFVGISVVDIDTMTIPDEFVIALIPFAALAAFLFPQAGLLARAAGVFCVSVPMLLLAMIIPGAFGGGDIKLMAVCGFLLGWKLTLAAMFIAVMLGGVVAAVLLASGRTKKGAHIPFGPALCAGCFAALLWGENLIGWYIGFF